MEYGRAADNTTFGVQVFALGAHAADDTTYGIQSLADVNVALREDRERSGRAADNTTFGV